MKFSLKMCSIFVAVFFLTLALIATDASARFGRGGSMGSRGSRSYSQPSRSYSPPRVSPSPNAPGRAPYAPASPQQPGGGFFRNFAGGIFGGMVGGLIGNMLFGRSGGGFGGGGIGLFEIILIGAGGYLIYRFFKKKKTKDRQPEDYSSQGVQYQDMNQPVLRSEEGDEGLAAIKRTDPYFNEERFTETAMDIFFKIQAAWMNKDLSAARPLLAGEMQEFFQKDLDNLNREKKTNHLENIAVRKVEITEIWQEAGQDFLTVLISANLLDYTTEDTSGAVIEGSKTDPVKFEEYWTFCRKIGSNLWMLSAITQA